jgi:hypothetical protein
MDQFSAAFILLALLIALFWIFRQIVLWYWKIDEQIELLSEIRDLLRNQSPSRTASSVSPPPATPDGRVGGSLGKSEKVYEFLPSDPKLAEAVNSLRKSGYDVVPLGGAWRISKDSRSVAFPSNDGELLAQAESLTRRTS